MSVVVVSQSAANPTRKSPAEPRWAPWPDFTQVQTRRDVEAIVVGMRSWRDGLGQDKDVAGLGEGKKLETRTR